MGKEDTHNYRVCWNEQRCIDWVTQERFEELSALKLINWYGIRSDEQIEYHYEDGTIHIYQPKKGKSFLGIS
jgi:hypothetical protein